MCRVCEARIPLPTSLASLKLLQYISVEMRLVASRVASLVVVQATTVNDSDWVSCVLFNSMSSAFFQGTNACTWQSELALLSSQSTEETTRVSKMLVTRPFTSGPPINQPRKLPIALLVLAPSTSHRQQALNYLGRILTFTPTHPSIDHRKGTLDYSVVETWLVR